MGRILVVGATGLIGAPVARRLVADTWTPLVWDTNVFARFMRSTISSSA